MVDEEVVGLNENEDFASDFVSDGKKLDSKEEPNLSFYECPTAAQSIQGFGEGDRYNSSLDSDQEFGYFEPSVKSDSLKFSNSTDGGSVSISQITKATGGYFAGYQAVLYQGTPTLKDKPESFLNETGFKATETVPNVVGYHPMNAENIVNTDRPTPFVTEGPVGNDLVIDNNIPTVQPTVTSVRSDFTNNVEVLNSGSGSLVAMSPSASSQTHNVLPAIAEAASANSELSWAADKSSSGVSYVQEGFDTITIPRYRPIEVVERTVEVPVVHHIDTFVPKKEIQEVESYVKKPYTKYVDKVVEVPEVHYSDKIVEVPEYHEVTKTVPKLEVQEKTKYVPKVEVKVVPKYVEVPVVKIVDKYEEYEEIEEVVKHVEKVEVVEVPREVVKHVVKPVRKVVEREKIVPVYQHRDVPVEKIKYVPKVETVEHLREVPKVVDVPVPYNVPKHHYVDQPYVVPKYRDVPVAVPVSKTVKPIYEYSGPTNYVDVPVHKPYFVIHDHLNFKPFANFTASNNNNFNPPNSGFNPSNNFNPNFNFPNNYPNFNPGNTFTPNFNTGNNYTTNSNPGYPHNSGSTTTVEFKDNMGVNPDVVSESVSYKVVGMNKVDLDKMATEEKKLAQEKLDEALNNPNFQVYKQSLQGTIPADVGSTFNPNPTTWTHPTTFSYPSNVTTEAFTGWSSEASLNPNPTVNAETEFKAPFETTVENTVNPVDNMKTFNPTTDANFKINKGFSSNFGPNLNKFGSFTTTQAPSNLTWNNWPSDFGARNPSSNWNKWNPENASVNVSEPNLNNKYKFDDNYSGNTFLNWTEKIFQFFTGSKSPLNSFNSNTFNTNTLSFNNPPKVFNNPMTHAAPKVMTPHNETYNAAGTGSSDHFWKGRGYNLVQESFRNWKVPNMHLDLEKNTPTNRAFFKDTDHYHMSSGSGSVGHRGVAAFQKSQVYPTSDENTPKVH